MGGLNVNSPREVQAEGIIITWSETNDELRGFSQKLGEWEVLKIDPQKLNPNQIIIPIVAANVAAVRIGDSVAAFSGEKGWWDVVDLAKGAGSESAAYPHVSPSLVKVEDNGHLYTFSASKGQWSSPTDPELQPATFEYPLNMKEMKMGKKSLMPGSNNYLSMKVAASHCMLSDYLDSDHNNTPKHDEGRSPESRRVLVPQEAGRERSNSSPGTETQFCGDRYPDYKAPRRSRQAGEHSSGRGRAAQQSKRRSGSAVTRASQACRAILRPPSAVAGTGSSAVEAEAAAGGEQPGRSSEVEGCDGDTANGGASATGQRKQSPSTEAGQPIDIAKTLPGFRIDRPEYRRCSNRECKFKDSMAAAGEIARQLRSFRESAISDMEAMRDPTMSVETWSQPLEKLIADGLLHPGTGEDAQRDGLVGAKERKSQLQKHLNDVRRDWNYAWSAYQSQLELFRLDLNDRRKKNPCSTRVKQQTDANRESPDAILPGKSESAKSSEKIPDSGSASGTDAEALR